MDHNVVGCLALLLYSDSRYGEYLLLVTCLGHQPLLGDVLLHSNTEQSSFLCSAAGALGSLIPLGMAGGRVEHI